MIGAHVAPPLAKEALVGTVCCMFESNIYQYEQHLFTLVNSNEVNDIKEREREREREREGGKRYRKKSSSFQAPEIIVNEKGREGSLSPFVPRVSATLPHSDAVVAAAVVSKMLPRPSQKLRQKQLCRFAPQISLFCNISYQIRKFLLKTISVTDM